MDDSCVQKNKLSHLLGGFSQLSIGSSPPIKLQNIRIGSLSPCQFLRSWLAYRRREVKVTPLGTIYSCILRQFYLLYTCRKGVWGSTVGNEGVYLLNQFMILRKNVNLGPSTWLGLKTRQVGNFNIRL